MAPKTDNLGGGTRRSWRDSSEDVRGSPVITWERTLSRSFENLLYVINRFYRRPRRSGARPSFQARTLTAELRINARLKLLLRKEVIQPQVPLRLPCYDFIPITSPALGRCIPKVSPRTSGRTGFHDVTGGVYKARERIHDAIADASLLAIPTSWSRVADSNPNWARF